MINGWCISSEVDRRLMSLDLTDNRATLVQLMDRCHQVTSQYLNLCWPSCVCISPYDITRPQWVKSFVCSFKSDLGNFFAVHLMSSFNGLLISVIDELFSSLIFLYVKVKSPKNYNPDFPTIVCLKSAFGKLYSSTSANNSILTGVQDIFIQKNLPRHYVT